MRSLLAAVSPVRLERDEKKTKKNIKVAFSLSTVQKEQIPENVSHFSRAKKLKKEKEPRGEASSLAALSIKMAGRGWGEESLDDERS